MTEHHARIIYLFLENPLRHVTITDGAYVYVQRSVARKLFSVRGLLPEVLCFSVCT